MEVEPGTVYERLAEKRADFLEMTAQLGEMDDADAVHDLRVAARRLREVLELIEMLEPGVGARPVLQAVKKAARELSRLRELDVGIEFLEILRADIPSFDGFSFWGLEALEVSLHCARAQARRRACRRLLPRRLPALEDLLARFDPDLDHVQEGVAREKIIVLAGRYYEIVAELAPGLLDLCPATTELHRLRIAVKKLRYALELLNDEGRARQLRLLKRLQEGLGSHRDWTVLGEFVQERRKELKGQAGHLETRVGLRALEPHIEALALQHLERMRVRVPKLRVLKNLEPFESDRTSVDGEVDE